MGYQIQAAGSTRQKRLVLGLSAAILLSGMGLAQQRGGTLTVGLGYDIDTLNVYSTGFLGDVQAAVVEGLVAPNEKAEYVPVLATRVPTVQNGGIKVAADNKSMVVTYQLRPGVKWSDGKPFTSADVKFTWETVKDPKFIAESKDGTEDIASIQTPNDLTVVVNYKRVAPDFKSTLFTFGILPKHTLEGKDLNTDNYNQMPLGTGPFKVSQFVKGQYVVLDRNPYYWRKDKAGVQLPYLDKMIFKIIPDSNTLVTQLKSGEIQMAYSVPYSQIAQLDNQPGLNVVKNPVLSWQHLDFNLKGPAPLRDINVRKAMAHALDRTTISKALGGYPIPIDTVVVPVFSYSNKNVPKYPYDPAKARQLLDAAGYKVGSDGIRAKNGQRLSFNIMAQAGRSTDEDAQQVIIAQMKAIGIELKPDNKAGVALRDARYKGGYDLYYGGWITSADPSYSVFFGSKGVNNGQGYSNPKIDALLATADSSLDPAVRTKALRDFQTTLMQDLPSIPVTSNPSMIVVTDKLGGFVPNPTNMTNFVNTSGWYLKK
ncbi:peptide ABC transporter substrate-binding protein [Deinococcus humi]|uniref:Peptide/nickel transport system substrate-binding protein n=1 Tax=Deinococcus humi TaxID=662880 RepID=A0A7W8NGH3_9DEIO|nr:peptide ABC transporter substrate-binding protein [Deinococcus humi]MBB5362972.1 peptide/nickel transport system substrate-binding protein [Deinococcus humi]GGO25346.1 peptide ABC transporter substrate-binding protein [Deinococcus humi]